MTMTDVDHSVDCIRCLAEDLSNVGVAVDDNGYCGHCHWAAKAEVEEGVYQLRQLLIRHQKYRLWCEARGLDPYP